MCGRFTLHLPPELLGSVFGVETPSQLPPRYNIAPSQLVSVIRAGEDDHNRIDLLKWGLVPSWAKDPAIGNKLINARSETAHEKPSFRSAIKSQRCIVPASGFYEWSTAGNSKQPWYIRHKDDSPMGFAGLWESWRTPAGDFLETFCILTTTANSFMATLHERMPVILQPEDYNLWLNRELSGPLHLSRLFQPSPAEDLAAYKVSTIVNSPSHESPQCIEPVS
jgi:putative SOS response-associated peptidase YedK